LLHQRVSKNCFQIQHFYLNLSVASADAWKRLQIPVKWAEMINRWLYHSEENQQWLFDHRLSSGRYTSTGAKENRVLSSNVSLL
jgi:hypothetical protein